MAERGREAQLSFDFGVDDERPGPVVCLGRSFKSDEQRRAFFRRELEAWLQSREARSTPGFPIGSVDHVLELSNPPWFTACPNPFLGCLFDSREPDPNRARVPPYAGRLESDTRHPVYRFHPYHTKVPPEVIRRLIEHYTEPGDLVLDAFSGSGMTGVAARECGRQAIVADLCPVAAFVSAVNGASHNVETACARIEGAIADSRLTLGHAYRTVHEGCELGVNYFVWSDVFTCPGCGFEFPFFPAGVIHHGNKVETRKAFDCPNPACAESLNVRRVERVITPDGVKKTALVWVNAGSGRARISRAPTPADLELAATLTATAPAAWYPTDRVNPNGYSAKLAQLGHKRIDDVSRFLSPRNLRVFADLWARLSACENPALRNVCRATLTSIFTVISERQGYFGGGGGMSGNLYMPIVRMEKNVYDSLRRKLDKVRKAEQAKRSDAPPVMVSTQSATHLSGVPDESIDYVYTDPPFGANIIYSEMNLILEAWLRVRTNDAAEAVIDSSRSREYDDYKALMRAALGEYFRVLKPGRWITVEFHNTQAEIWNLLQTVIGEAGFVVAQVGVLDKGTTTILGDIRPGSAKHDLLISAYKPDRESAHQFELSAGTAQGAWAFVREHLGQLPLVIDRDNTQAAVPGRTRHFLFDRMVARHVQLGLSVPLSTTEFYAGLAERFEERYEMYFLPSQVEAWAALRGNEVQQLPVIADDERSTIRWLSARLATGPASAELLRTELDDIGSSWSPYEELISLEAILEESLVPQGESTWRLPAPSEARTLAAQRRSRLLDVFADYAGDDEPLHRVRTEAIRAGFEARLRTGDLETIRHVCSRLPEGLVKKDPSLLMYYDVAHAEDDEGYRP